MYPISICWAYCQAIVRSRIKNERGASLVDYALLLAPIVVVCVVAVTMIAQNSEERFSSTADEL